MHKMMKYSLIIVLLTGLFLSCEREISPDQADSFIKFYGNYMLDQSGDVEVLSGGGYAICGTVTDGSVGKRMVLIVTDKYGTVQNGFPKYYSMEGFQTGGSSLIVLQGGSGGFFLSGYVEKPAGGTTSALQKDIFVVRTSANGEEIWHRSYGSAEDEQVLHSIERINSGYLLAGSHTRNGKSDILIMGITEEGDSAKLGLNYNNPNAVNSVASFLLKSGNMYLCACTYDRPNNEGTGIQVLTFDDELSPLAKNLSGEFEESGMCILERSEGQFLILGNRMNTAGVSEIVLYGAETNGLLITNSSLLATISEGNTDLTGKKVIKTAKGGLAIVGTRSAGENSEVLLQFVSSTIQVGDQVSFGASGAQTGSDIELTRDGGYIVLGTNSYGESSMISLMKTSATGDI
jgi:hypothetical protein